jgi:hypothetical protein
MLNADSARPQYRRNHSLVCIYCYQSRHRQNFISIFSALHKRRTRTVKRDGHWLCYYIRNRFLKRHTCPLLVLKRVVEPN